jgi:hypothetical protein
MEGGGKKGKGKKQERHEKKKQPMIDKDRHQTRIQYASENIRYHAPPCPPARGLRIK